MKNYQARIGGNTLKQFSRGFSLIEIMVVVTLMAILVGVGTVFFMGRLEDGKIETARTQAYEIAKALDLYKLQMGDYPTASEGLGALVNPPHGQPFMKEMPKDSWGHEYNYANPGVHNPRGVDVWSNGPSSGTEDGRQEIGNWRAE